MDSYINYWSGIYIRAETSVEVVADTDAHDPRPFHLLHGDILWASILHYGLVYYTMD